MKQLRVNKITEYLEAKKNFEKDYIGIEEQDIDDIDTNYFIAYAIDVYKRQPLMYMIRTLHIHTAITQMSTVDTNSNTVLRELTNIMKKEQKSASDFL